MKKLIIAAAALAFLSGPVLAGCGKGPPCSADSGWTKGNGKGR